MKSKTNPFCSAATLAAKNPTHRSVMKTKTPSMKTSYRILTTSIAMLLGAASAHAATYYWDTDGSGTPGFGTASGTWGTSTFWGTDSAGSGATANTTITTADDVNFGTASAG